MEVAVKNLPATEQRLNEYASAHMRDPIFSQILQYCREGGPDKKKHFVPSQESPRKLHC